MGLECGSKPELLIVLPRVKDPEALIICNGYKDAEYIEMALLAQKLGRNCVIVVEQAKELDLILKMSTELNISLKSVCAPVWRRKALGAGQHPLEIKPSLVWACQGFYASCKNLTRLTCYTLSNFCISISVAKFQTSAPLKAP